MTTDQNPAQDQEPDAKTEPDQGAVDQGGQEPDPLAELPEWAQAKIKNLRSEAASYRTRARDAEEALKSAKTPEEVAAAQRAFTEQIASLNDEILRRDVADAYGLPKELAALLPKGSDKKALEAIAASLEPYAKAPSRTPRAPSGGSEPNEPAAAFDPEAEIAKVRRLGF